MAINYLAVVIATLAGFGLGAIWYMTLGRVWMRALGKTEAELTPKTSAAKAMPFVISIVALFVMAWMLAGLMGHIAQVNVRGGALAGFFVWLGFVITTMGVNHAFAREKPMLTLIDGGHWLAVLVVMGLVIGAFGT